MSRKTPSPHGVLRRSIDGCKKQHLPTSNTFWKKSTHKPWIPTRKPLRKTRLNYSLSTTLIHDFAGMITLGPVFWTSLHGCKRKHPRNCKWTKVSKSSSHFCWGAASFVASTHLGHLSSRDINSLNLVLIHLIMVFQQSQWEHVFLPHIHPFEWFCSAQVLGNESRASIPLLEWNSCSPFKYSSRHCDLSASQKSRQ